MTKIDDLIEQVREGFVKTDALADFLPHDVATQLLTAEVLDQIFSELNEAGRLRIDLTPKILNGKQGLFLALVYVKATDDIQQWTLTFIDKLEHLALPLSMEELQECSPRHYKQVAKEQDKFCPFMFRKDMHENLVHLADGVILPYTKETSLDDLAGSSGKIRESTIHPSLQEFFPKDGPAVVIRKEIAKRSHETEIEYEKRIERERKCLVQLRKLSNPNIIPLLGCYIYRGHASFLFPRFPMNLGQLFTTQERPSQLRSDVSLYAALRGLASAVHDLHRFPPRESHDEPKGQAKGYHLDIRPANVLVGETLCLSLPIDAEHDGDTEVIDGSWTFHLADFGLSNVKEMHEISETTYRGGGGQYQAPEGDRSGRVGRPFDVWALGCLFSDVATYMKLGYRGVRDFQRKRTTEHNSIESGEFHQNNCLKEPVNAWLRGLMQGDSPSSSTSPQLLSDLVDLAKRCLEIDPDRRPMMPDVLGTLSDISLRAHVEALDIAFSELDSLNAASLASAGLNKDELMEFRSAVSGRGPASIVSDGRGGMQSNDRNKEYNDLVNDMASLTRILKRAAAAQRGISSKATRSATKARVHELMQRICPPRDAPSPSRKSPAIDVPQWIEEITATPEGKVVVVGSLNLDIIQLVDSLPGRCGHHFRGNTRMEQPGGHGFNQAIACARLSSRKLDSDVGGELPPQPTVDQSMRAGAAPAEARPWSTEPLGIRLRVSMVGVVGDDKPGREIKQSLGDHGIDTQNVHLLPGQATGKADVLVDPTGQSMVWNHSTDNANDRLVPKCLPEIEHCADMVLTQLETPLETVKEVVHRADKAKMSVVLNLAPWRSELKTIQHELLSVDHLIMNAATADAIATATAAAAHWRTHGEPPKHLEGSGKRPWEAYMADCEDFANKGARVVVITLGQRGAVALVTNKRGPPGNSSNYNNNNGKDIVERFHVAAVHRKGHSRTDVTGASDAFIGAYVVELLRQRKSGKEENINAAVKAGIKAGGFAVSLLGSFDSLPWADDVLNPDDFELVDNNRLAQDASSSDD